MSRRRGPWLQLPPIGKAVPEDLDPLTLDGLTAFRMYTVEENDLHFTLYFDWVSGERRLFVAEEADAVYVALVHTPPPPLPDGVHEGWALSNPLFTAHGMLERPLAERAIIDASRSEPAKRFDREPEFEDLWRLDPDNRYWHESERPNRALRRRRPRT